MPYTPVTRTWTVPAVCLGDTTVNFVADRTLIDVPGVVPKATLVTLVNPVQVIVTGVPLLAEPVAPRTSPPVGRQRCSGHAL